MPEPKLAATYSPQFSLRFVMGVFLCTSLAAGASLFLIKQHSVVSSELAAGEPDDSVPAKKEPTVGGLKLFSTWPADQAPDLAFVLTGQTYGYVSPCGCTSPQKGGLERRANFIDSLRARGWPVVGLDLGDIAPEKGVQIGRASCRERV